MQYFDIELEGSSDVHSTAGLLLQAVHGVIASGSGALAVDFPDMGADGQTLYAGLRRMRVFGVTSALEALRARREVLVLVDNQEIMLSSIQETPVTEEHVVCHRVRQAEHVVSPSRARRHARRAVARGELPKEVRAAIPQAAPALAFKLHSRSTGQVMVLHVRRERVKGPARLGTVTSYGFSGLDSALPAF